MLRELNIKVIASTRGAKMTTSTYEMKEFTYYFKGFSGVKSKCHIRILNKSSEQTVIMCSQFCKNAGTSITNMVEEIAAYMKKHVKKDDVIWIEHYGKNIGIHENSSYSVVKFNNNTELPEWIYCSIDKIVELTGYDKKNFETPSEVKCK